MQLQPTSSELCGGSFNRYDHTVTTANLASAVPRLQCRMQGRLHRDEMNAAFRAAVLSRRSSSSSASAAGAADAAGDGEDWTPVRWEWVHGHQARRSSRGSVVVVVVQWW